MNSMFFLSITIKNTLGYDVHQLCQKLWKNTYMCRRKLLFILRKKSKECLFLLFLNTCCYCCSFLISPHTGVWKIQMG